MNDDVLELDKDQISELIPDVEDKFFTDSAYAVIDEDWIVKVGYKGYRKWVEFAGLSKWKTNWDCDNLAASFKLYYKYFTPSTTHIPLLKDGRRSVKI